MTCSSTATAVQIAMAYSAMRQYPHTLVTRNPCRAAAKTWDEWQDDRTRHIAQPSVPADDKRVGLKTAQRPGDAHRQRHADEGADEAGEEEAERHGNVGVVVEVEACERVKDLHFHRPF